MLNSRSYYQSRTSSTNNSSWQIIQIGQPMEKANINVIIFEDDDPPAKDQRESRTYNSSKPNQQLGSHQYQIIEQEIQYLSEKIRSLETQTEGFGLIKNESNVPQKNSSASFEGDHTKEILAAIEKKIQIMVREIRKVVDKMGEGFEKKLQLKINKKLDELQIGKLREGYAASVRKIEEGYRRDLERVSREYKQAQNRMSSRVAETELKFINKMNDFKIKEKEYIDWIHHLEIQLKEKQMLKSKKMIEVTQEKACKKQATDTNSVVSNNMENNYSRSNQPFSSQQRVSLHPNPNDTSKMQRKHRIFDSNKGSSVSPNNKVSTSSNLLQSTKLINPSLKQKTSSEPEPVLQQATISLATKANDPQKNIENESSPWRMMEKSADRRGQRNQVAEDVKEEQFYKDVPKPNSGWERFADFKDNDGSSESDDDVLFYREGEQYEHFLQNFQSKKQRVSSGQEKVFSPFDLS